MPAGADEVAYAIEDSFATLPGTPTWRQPGVNVSPNTFTLERNQTRNRHPNDPRPAGSRPGNRQTALDIEWGLTDMNWQELVFSGGSNDALPSSGSTAPTATWYISHTQADGTTQERFLQGVPVQQFNLSYQQGDEVTVNFTSAAAQEYDASDSAAPSVPQSIAQPSESDLANFSAFDLALNSTTITKLQSFSLDISNLARFERGQQQEPYEAVIGGLQPSFTAEAIITGSGRRELAYGTSSATSPNDSIDKVDGTVTVGNSSGTLATFTLTDWQTDTYDWQSIASPDTDQTENVSAHVRDVTVA